MMAELQKALAQKFDGLSKEVHKERHDKEFDAAKRKSSFEKRISADIALCIAVIGSMTCFSCEVCIHNSTSCRK